MEKKEKKVKDPLLRTYYVSLLSMVLCVTMFFGTTMAWFTSETTNSGNEIYVGSLKVGLQKQSDAGEWVMLDSSAESAKLFDSNVKMAPEKTVTETVRIVDLAGDGISFRYSVSLSLESSELPLGDTEVTLDTLKESFYIYVDDQLLGTLGEYINEKEAEDPKPIISGVMLDPAEGAADTYTIKLEMKADASEKLMGAKLNLNVKMVATQMSQAARDSLITVTTAQELRDALTGLKAGDHVILLNDIDLTDTDWEPLNINISSGERVVIDGNGHTISNLEQNNAEKGGLIGRLATYAPVTIQNLTLYDFRLTGTNADGEGAGGALIGWLEHHGGSVTVKNVTATYPGVENFKYIGGLVGYQSGERTVMINCSVKYGSLNSTYSETGTSGETQVQIFKGHAGGLVGLFSNGAIINCTVENTKVAVTAAEGAQVKERVGAVAGTVYEAVAVDATVTGVEVNGQPASADTVFGKDASGADPSGVVITAAP